MNTKEKEEYIEKHRLFIEKYKLKNIHLSPYNLVVNESIIDFLKSKEEKCVVIIGNSGIGKTHLIHFLIVNKDLKNSLYIDTSSLIETLYSHLKLNHSIHEWIIWLCSYELIIFDNFHLVKNKQKMIDFFQLLIDKARSQKIKIIFVWTKISSMENILNFGKKINFPNPDKETLKSIASYFLEFNFKKLKLTNKALELLIDTIPPNIKLLTDKLLELALIHENLCLPLIKEDAIKKLINEQTKSNLENSIQTIQNLIHKICKNLKFEPSEIMSNSRKKDIVYKRNIVIYLVKKLSNLTHQEIGEAFKRNHSTITHSIKQIELKMKNKYFSEYLKTFL